MGCQGCQENVLLWLVAAEQDGRAVFLGATARDATGPFLAVPAPAAGEDVPDEAIDGHTDGVEILAFNEGLVAHGAFHLLPPEERVEAGAPVAWCTPGADDCRHHRAGRLHGVQVATGRLAVDGDRADVLEGQRSVAPFADEAAWLLRMGEATTAVGSNHTGTLRTVLRNHPMARGVEYPVGCRYIFGC